MRTALLLPLALSLALASGCSETSAPPADAGATPDAGGSPPDGGPGLDAGARDGGPGDAGGTHTAEGGRGAEVRLTFPGAFPRQSQVDTTASHYQVDGLTPFKTYTVSIAGVTANADLEVFAAPGYLQATCARASPGDDLCSAAAATASLWIRVSGANTAAGAAFTLNVVERTGGGQGTSDRPVVLTLDTPYAGEIEGFGTNHYAFTTGDRDRFFDIALTQTQSDLRWELYSNPDVTAPGGFVRGCNGSGSPADESCRVPLEPSSTYYLKVFEGDGLAGTFTVAVRRFVDTGPDITPISVGAELTGLAIGPKATRYFSFRTGPTEMRAKVSLRRGTTNLAWNLFYSAENREQTVSSCDALNSPGDEVCVSSLPLFANFDFYVGVTNRDDAEATFDLLVEQGGGTAEGTASAPEIIPYSPDLARPSTVDVAQGSWYRVDGLDPAATYLVSASGATDPIALAVFTDDAYSAFACDEGFALGRDSSCAVRPAGGSLWISVRASDTVAGASFTLHVARSPFDLIPYGMLVANQTIPAGGVRRYRFFQSNTIGSYYEITVVPGFEPPVDLRWTLYDQPDLETPFATCNNGTEGVEICRTPAPMVYATYYLVIENASPVPGTFEFSVY